MDSEQRLMVGLRILRICRVRRVNLHTVPKHHGLRMRT
jgi:hypothetical protein